METFVTVCGFIGGWLLVAGSVYQAALELKEESIEEDHLEATRQKITPRSQVSAWWWLVPPVKIIQERRKADAYRQDFLTALPDEDVELLISFIHKATAWLFVAMGGLLLALNETYAFVRIVKISDLWFWVFTAGLTLLSLTNTAYQIARGERLASKHTGKV